MTTRMITIRNELGVAVMAPDGEYDLDELARAFDRISMLFAGAPARGLIMDLSRARGFEHQSVVRIREMARFVALHASAFGGRVAVVAPVRTAVAATDVAATDVAAVVTRTHGVAYQVHRDLADARAWILGPASRAASAARDPRGENEVPAR